MPRKGFSNFDDYDDGFDDDYDYDVDVEEDEHEADEPEEEVVIAKRGLWRCAICTYDNDESMHVCDICGVIRHPVPGGNKTINNNTVEGRCKEPMVSKLAKSLFESNSLKKGVLYQPEHKNLVLAQGALPRISRGNIHDLHKAFSSKNSSVSSIAPFKFDAPSPDDLVSNGLKSSRTGPKDSMKNKEKQDSAEHNQTSSQGRHDNVGVGGIQSFKSLPKAKADKSKETSSSSKNMEVSESLTSTMNNMSLTGETETSRDVKIRSAKSKSNHKPEEWMMLDKESDALSQLNLAIVGHVDSGKSTLSGRLLHLLGRISQKQMHKFEKEAKSQGKGSFAYAWALDESAEERERGITMTVAVAYFNSKRHHVVLLDSPGHKDFVPNMIAGATQADAAILVIDASIGAFEAGFDNLKGQTREHARVLRGFGVEQVIVAVNKMDIVGYSKERFELIKQHVGSFLHSCRFKESSLTWIPLSAMENQNLVSAPSESRLSSWYQGPCLLDAVDSVKSPDRDISKPLLMPICDVVRSSSGQVSACGKLEAGAVRSGSKVMVMPSGDQGTVKSLERDSQGCSIARAGDNVAIALQGIDANQVMAGGVLCHPDYPVSVATRLELMVLVLEGATPILLGSQLEFHVHFLATHVKSPNSLPIETPPHIISLGAGEAFGRRRRAICTTARSSPSSASFFVVLSLCSVVSVVSNNAVSSSFSVTTAPVLSSTYLRVSPPPPLLTVMKSSHLSTLPETISNHGRSLLLTLSVLLFHPGIVKPRTCGSMLSMKNLQLDPTYAEPLEPDLLVSLVLGFTSPSPVRRLCQSTPLSRLSPSPDRVTNASHRLHPTPASFLTCLYATDYTPNIEAAPSHQGFYGAKLHRLDLRLLVTTGPIVQECCFARFPHEVFTVASLSHYAVSSIDGSSQNRICGLPDLLVAGTIVQECGLARFTNSITAAIPSHYAVSSIDGSSQLCDLHTGVVTRRPIHPEAFYLLSDVCSHTLWLNESDDYLLRSSVTTCWARHGNVEFRVLDPIQPSALSSNLCSPSASLEVKLELEIHLVYSVSHVGFKADRTCFSAKSSQIGLSSLNVVYGSGASHLKFLPINIPTSSYRCFNVVFDYQLFFRTIAMGTKVKLLFGFLHFAERDSPLYGSISSFSVLVSSFILPSSRAPGLSASAVNVAL